MLRTTFLLACFIAWSAAAQEYPFVHYTPKDGLVNSRVRKAYQDSKGRMYFLTFGGLSVYDGYRFKNYTAQNGLPDDLVNDVLEIGNDSLLVATNTCGLTAFVKGQIEKIKLEGSHCPVVNFFLKSNEGAVYATADDGLYKLNGHRFEKLSTKIPGHGDPVVYLGAMADYGNFLIFATYDLRSLTGLCLYNKTTNRITDALSAFVVQSLKTDKAGLPWLSNGTDLYKVDTAAISRGKLVLTNTLKLTGGNIAAGLITFNQQNEVFIASPHQRIIHYRNDGSPVNLGYPSGSSFSTQDFFIDREDVLWICQDGNGVYKLSNTGLQSLPNFFEGNFSGVHLLAQGTKDSCWMVMNNKKLVLQTVAGLQSFIVAPSVLPTFLHYKTGFLYAGFSNHLYVAPVPKERQAAVSFTQVLSVSDTSFFRPRSVNDPYGNMIFYESQNLCVIKNGKLLFRYPTGLLDLIEGLYVDEEKQLWVVTRGNGLKVFSIHPETPAAYLQKKEGYLKEFEGCSPRCMAVDNRGVLWVGTRKDGLLGFEHTTGQLLKRYHFKVQNGLTDNFVTAIAVDRKNNVLIGTQTGVDRLLRLNNGNYRIENVTKSNNLFSYISYIWMDKAQNAFALTNAGTVFKVAPAGTQNNLYQPQLFIGEIKVNGKAMPASNFPMRLRYDQGNISIALAAPTFIDEKQVTYTYLLSGGAASNWSDTTASADINLLNLSPGSYTLQVKAFFTAAVYPPKELSFAFVILPPWWQRWWFKMLWMAAAIAVIAAGIRFYYRRKLYRQKMLLEKQQAIEKERTRIATDMHDDLGAGLSTLKFLSEKVKRNSFSEVTRIDADKIVTNSNELVQKMNEIIWAMNEKNDTLEDLLFYTRSYAVEYCDENNLHCSVQLPQAIPQIFVSGEMRRNVFLLVKESLHNVVKHARATTVAIEFTAGKELLVSIQDNGKGFTDPKPAHGNGLRNMKKRVETIGGHLEIQNVNGVLVFMQMPLNAV